MKIYRFDLEPVPSPRINKGDRRLFWVDISMLSKKDRQRREMLERYYNYKKSLQVLAMEQGLKLPNGNWHVIFYKPMNKSWSKKKRDSMRGTPCQVMPDTDNYIKAFKDALKKQDNSVYDERASKYWADTGYIEVITDIPRITQVFKYIEENFGKEHLTQVYALR